MNFQRFIPFLFCFIFCVGLSAQVNNHYLSPVNEYEYGVELFQKRKYGAAQKQFLKAIQRLNDTKSEFSISAEYYSAMCAIELFNKDAERLFLTFIENHPQNPKVKTAYFHLGRYNYRKRKWKKVVEWLAKVDVYDLTIDEWAEYYFIQGYSYYEEEDFENAAKSFYEIKDVDTKYTAPATYFYSHISYTKKDYETALVGFKKLEGDEKFGQIVPYYITQILYLGEKYKELIDYAPALLDSAQPTRASEIARLLGESYYRLKSYKEAIPYLERYQNETRGAKDEDLYQLGYAYYQTKEYEKAVSLFKQVVYQESELAQTAYYHMAECYMSMNKNQFAITSFYEAYKMDFDIKIKENALFNYAKLSFEQQYDPYFKAAEAIWQYIEKYPESERRDEALSYLTTIYLNSSNYKAAMVSMDAIKEYNEPLKKAYQLVAYNLAVDNLNEGYFEPAIYNFEKARKFPYNRAINTLTYYWSADAYYQLKRYSKAIENYKAFIYMPEAILQDVFVSAYYNLGYAYFKTKQYEDAILWFRKYLVDETKANEIKLQDCYLRVGDCYFVTKEYDYAIDYYTKSTDMDGIDTDYALYQKALALGLLKRESEKIETLEKMVADYKKSTFLADAQFQLAESYMKSGLNDKALKLFDVMLETYPNGAYTKKCMMNKGQILYNENQYEESLTVYMEVIGTYPKHYEATISHDQIRKIYVKLNQIDKYEEFMQTAQLNLTDGVIDSATYDATYLKYIEGDCEKAITGFAKYLERFPDGIFAVQSHYYKAECDFTKNNLPKALESFRYVISKPVSGFTEPSLVKASKINFDNGNYKEALANYVSLEQIAEYKSNILEARIGQMRCFYKLRNYDAAIDYVNKVLATEKVSSKMVEEAHLIGGKSALELNNLELALSEFKTTLEISKNVNAAEASYNIAYVLYEQEKYTEAETQLFDLVNNHAFYDYWVAKGLMLLSDVYLATGDAFQAKHTLQSIIENYEGQGLRDIAEQKLNDILKSEKQVETKSQKQTIEVLFEMPQDPATEKLFEDESIINTEETDESDL